MEGHQLTEVAIKGELCSLASEFMITGQLKCGLPGSTMEAARHEVLCGPSGSEAKAGGKQATIPFAEEIELSSGKEFSFRNS
jgi:hypothetical protein